MGKEDEKDGYESPEVAAAAEFDAEGGKPNPEEKQKLSAERSALQYRIWQLKYVGRPGYKVFVPDMKNPRQLSGSERAEVTGLEGQMQAIDAKLGEPHQEYASEQDEPRPVRQFTRAEVNASHVRI